MIRGGWKLGRIGGVEIQADPSISLIAILLSFNLWVAFSDQARFPGLGQGQAVVLSIATTLLFLLSILAHELAHAAMFKARGIPVAGIILYMFGGATQAKEEVKRPGDEFVVTAAGPAATAALGGIFLALHTYGGGFLARPVRVGMFGPLALANMLMAGFNLLPGYPLDGGQMRGAAVWRATGSRNRATVIAARAGQVVAAAIVGGGMVLAFASEDALFGVWPAVIGVFLFRAATGALSAGTRLRLLESTTAAQVMSPPPPSVSGDLPVSVVMERYLAGHDGEAFPVIEGGHVAGFVSMRTASRVPLDRPAREAMAGPQAVVEARPDESMRVVSERMRAGQSETAMVLDQGRLVGVIERQDLIRLFRRRTPTDSLAPRRPDS